MARKEMVTSDAIFLDSTTRRAVHVGISTRVASAIEGMFAEPDCRTRNILLHRSKSGQEQQRIVFTDVLVVQVSGPGCKPPEEFVI